MMQSIRRFQGRHGDLPVFSPLGRAPPGLGNFLLGLLAYHSYWGFTGVEGFASRPNGTDAFPTHPG